MVGEYFEHKKFPATGECIYCGALGSEVELTDEHIVPYSLGGNVELLQASCKKCARVTGGLEGYVGLRRYLALGGIGLLLADLRERGIATGQHRDPQWLVVR